MVRPLRIEYPGAIYHVTSRGNERRELYADEADRKHFIKLLREASDFFMVEVIAYCLMSNHFHLMLRTPKANLGKFMQWLNVSYTRYFNIKYKRVGHLFQGRYKAILVESEDYYLELSRYIHLNPVKLLKYKNAAVQQKRNILNGYMWSSYVGTITPGKRVEYIRYDRILNSVGGDTTKGRRKYEEYVLSGINNKIDNPMENVKGQLLLGGESFIEWVKEKFVNDRKEKRNEYIGIKKLYEVRPIADLAELVAGSYGLKKEELLKKHSVHREARQVLIELVYRTNIQSISLSDLGKGLGGISGAAIGKAHERARKILAGDSSLRKRLDELLKSVVEN